MADEDAVKRLEARLTRLEATLANLPSTAGTTSGVTPNLAVVDPAPWPWGGVGWGGWGGWGGWVPRPIGDPAAFAASALAAARWPGVVTDPGP